MKTIIKNAIIVSNGKKDTEKKHIYIQNGKIEKISDTLDNINENIDTIIDANGKYVLPGFIDIECKMPENGYESRDNLNILRGAGAEGGFTTIMISASTKPIVDDRGRVEYILSKTRKDEHINIYPLGNMTKDGLRKHLSEIGEMISTGTIAISDGGHAIEDLNLLRDIFLYSKMFDITLITSTIDKGFLNLGTVHHGYMSTKLGLEGIPREAEEIEIAKHIILAKYTGARVHISNITTKGAVKLIKDAKDEGVNITCSTAPHYFSLDESAIDNYNTLAKVLPPLREKGDLIAIKNGIKDNTIDIISSGHEPVLAEKKHTEFERAEFGISSIESTFNIINTFLIRENIINIEKLSLLLSKTPAKILGFDKKGEIKTGYDGDIVIIDPDVKKDINASTFISKAKYSPYDKKIVYGEVLYTIVAGKVVYDQKNNTNITKYC